MKKILLGILGICLSLSLVGCSSGTKQYDEETTTSAEPTASEATTDDIDYTVLRIGMECAYAPFNWQEDAANEYTLPIDNLEGFYADGYDIQIAKAIGEQLGVEVQIVKLSWSGLIEALNAGQIDLIIAGMADTEERKQSIGFTTRYSTKSEYVIMTQKDSPFATATSIQDLTGAYVLGQKDTQYDAVIDQIEGVNHVAAVEGVPNMLTRLQQGTVDAIVLDNDTASSYLDSYPEFTMVEFADGSGFDKGFTGACIGLRKDDEALLAKINEVLATIPDSEREEIWNAAVERQPK